MTSPEQQRWPHSRVASVRGPAFCCKECSLDRGNYVEWPCPGTLLLTFAILGAAVREEMDASVASVTRSNEGDDRG